ncbi:MAG: MFS transporter, partial [Clostridia bacterium]|nr:MFS transporter [Clostridia bacterium]
MINPRGEEYELRLLHSGFCCPSICSAHRLIRAVRVRSGVRFPFSVRSGFVLPASKNVRSKAMKMNHPTPTMRPFLMLWASQSVSALGTAMTNYALVIWLYNQNGTASGISLLTLCSYLPTILLRFIAGAAADRWNKKRIMLFSDLLAACGTCTILILYSFSALAITHLYLINFLLSLMNAIQAPAAYVATSLLVPEEYYARIGGLQTISGALVSILSPVLGALVLVWGGIPAVLTIDLFTFSVAFITLIFIRIPEDKRGKEAAEPFSRTYTAGIRYLKEHPVLLRLIVYIAAVNFLAKLGSDGQMSVFILSRTNGDQATLGSVQSAVALGLLAGGSLSALAKPARDHRRLIIAMCCLIFTAGIPLALGRNPVVWCAASFFQYLFAAIMNVHWGAYMRTAV